MILNLGKFFTKNLNEIISNSKKTKHRHFGVEIFGLVKSCLPSKLCSTTSPHTVTRDWYKCSRLNAARPLL